MDRLDEMFLAQKRLMEKYHEIERKNGQLQTSKKVLDLNDRHSQARLKDFAWRFTEEIAEALNEGSRSHEANVEFIDALHFLIELTLMLDVKPNDIIKYKTLKGSQYDNLDQLVEYVTVYYGRNNPDENIRSKAIAYSPDVLIVTMITHLGMCMNTLKLKPWSQTPRETDKGRFFHHFQQLWYSYIALLIKVGFDTDDIYETYLGKNKENQNRQKEGY